MHRINGKISKILTVVISEWSVNRNRDVFIFFFLLVYSLTIQRANMQLK